MAKKKKKIDFLGSVGFLQQFKHKAKLSHQTDEQQNVSILVYVYVLEARENNTLWNKSSMSVCGLFLNPPFRIKT